MTKKEYKRKLGTQRFFGLLMLIATVIIIAIAMTGSTTETKDATAILFTGPLGLFLLSTKEIIIQ